MRVKERAEAIGTLRFVSVFFMETLAAWTPTTPELEVKTLFGRHIWLMAQSADALGRRAHELRAELHYSRPPNAAFMEALGQLRAVVGTRERIAALYGLALEALLAACRDYRHASDALVDEPSHAVLAEIERRVDAMRDDRARLLAEMPQFGPAGEPDLAPLREAFARAGDMIGHGASPGRAAA